MAVRCSRSSHRASVYSIVGRIDVLTYLGLLHISAANAVTERFLHSFGNGKEGTLQTLLRQKSRARTTYNFTGARANFG